MRLDVLRQAPLLRESLTASGRVAHKRQARVQPRFRVQRRRPLRLLPQTLYSTVSPARFTLPFPRRVVRRLGVIRRVVFTRSERHVFRVLVRSPGSPAPGANPALQRRIPRLWAHAAARVVDVLGERRHGGRRSALESRHDGSSQSKGFGSAAEAAQGMEVRRGRDDRDALVLRVRECRHHVRVPAGALRGFIPAVGSNRGFVFDRVWYLGPRSLLRRHPAPWELGPFAVVVGTRGEEGSALPHGERFVWGVVAVGVCPVGVVRVGL